MQTLIQCGADRLLTSGQQAKAVQGAELIRTLQERFGKEKNRSSPAAGSMRRMPVRSWNRPGSGRCIPHARIIDAIRRQKKDRSAMLI